MPPSVVRREQKSRVSGHCASLSIEERKDALPSLDDPKKNEDDQHSLLVRQAPRPEFLAQLRGQINKAKAWATDGPALSYPSGPSGISGNTSGRMTNIDSVVIRTDVSRCGTRTSHLSGTRRYVDEEASLSTAAGEVIKNGSCVSVRWAHRTGR